MLHPRGSGSIWAERAIVVLIVASLAGTLNLVMAVYRRTAIVRPEVDSIPVAAVRPSPAESAPLKAIPAPLASARPARKPVAIRPPAPPPEDPTKKALDELGVAAAREIEESRKADRRTASLEAARQVAVGEAERWRRREMLVKQQVAGLAQRAEKADREIEVLSAERDVLARERDSLKAAFAKAQQGKGSFAVLPYKGPNGTWRRPIVMECTNGTVTLRPKGPTFTMLDLSGLINPRSSPVIKAIARELLRIETAESPDGAAVVPYFVFLIRPDGIRPYYEARGRLEPLGITFGYELIDQNMKVDVPDFDNLATWDGSIPIEDPAGGGLAGAGGSSSREPLGWPSGEPVAGASGRAGPGGTGAWPGESTTGSQPGSGDSADDFVWPSRKGRGQARILAESNGPGEKPSDGRSTGNETAQGSKPKMSGAGNGGKTGMTGGYGPEDSVIGKPDGEAGARGVRGNSGLERWPVARRSAVGGSMPGDSENGGSFGVPGVENGGTDRGGWGAGSGRRSESSLESGPAQLPELESADGALSSSPGKPGSGLVDPKAQTRSRSVSGRVGSEAAGGRADTPPGGSLAGTGDQAAEDHSLFSEAGPEGRFAGTGSGSKPGSGSASSSPSSSTGLGRDLAGGAKGSGSTSAASAPAGTLGLSLGSALGMSAGAAASGSGLTIGSEAGSPSGTAKGRSDGMGIPEAVTEKRKKTIEVPFEIVVVCRPEGIVIHPGGYRIKSSSLQEPSKDSLLVRELIAVAQKRAEADPTILPKPRVKFLVESDGSPAFWSARKQVLFSGLSWPMSLQVAGGQNPHLSGRQVW